MSIFFIALNLLGIAFAVSTNRDVFSPAKLYFAHTSLFYMGIYSETQPMGVYLCYFALILIGMGLAIFESRYDWAKKPPDPFFLSPLKVTKIVSLLWGFSVVPIAMLLYMIYLMGGIFGYLNTLSNRVVEWRGFGSILVFAAWFSTFNLIYFAVIMASKNRNRRDWLLYGLHFLMALAIAMLSGSRGFLNNVILMALCAGYISKPFNIKLAVIGGSSLLAIALCWGALRNSIKISDDGIETGLSSGKSIFETGSLNSGSLQLGLIFSRDPERLEGGSTFLSAITNFVPRTLWPGKPDSGGIIFTNDYMPDAWGGSSFLSTGIVAEGALNFGQILGSAFGLIFFGLLLFFLENYYAKLVTSSRSSELDYFYQILMYGILLFGITGLTIAEFTQTFVGFTSIKIAPVLLFSFLSKRICIERHPSFDFVK